MVSTTVSVCLPLRIYEKTQELKINRSGVARRAIEQEVERVEKEARGKPSTATSPDYHTPSEVDR